MPQSGKRHGMIKRTNHKLENKGVNDYVYKIQNSNRICPIIEKEETNG